MKTGNTFTYRHSELPSVPPEIQAEIVALDVQIADLILRSQGNYRALEQLTEVLDNCLDSCELNLHSIRIISDDSPQSAAITMMDLPMSEKQIIFSTALTSSIAIEALASLYDKTPQEMASILSGGICNRDMDVTTDRVDAVIKELIETWNAKPN
jgi:hypothetical protein